MEQDAQCYVFGAGLFWGLQERPRSGDGIIAADGGYLHCLEEGLQPDLLLGDFDSLQHIPEQIDLLRFPAEKDDTDSMLAIKEGLRRGFRRFALYGCSGGRLDHTLGNVQALAYLAKAGAHGFLYAEHEVFCAIACETLQLPARAEGLFSVFCLGADVFISIRGAHYPLEHKLMCASVALGLSNRFLGKTVEIIAEDGCLLVSWPREGPQPMDFQPTNQYGEVF